MRTAHNQRLGQPKALYLLFAVQMWECFSYYGMRSLLILYMIDKLGFNDLRAYGIYAVYCSIVEFGGILGGRLADKLLGLRTSIALGGWLIAAGHVCLSLQENNAVFFLGLALIVVGSGLFTTNISALLGLFYGENDSRRESGYTLFYVGINIGALLASLFCGIIGETYGWHYGFGLAAIGMLFGNLLFLFSGHILEDKGYPTTSLKKREITYCGLLMILVIPLTACMIFYADLFMQILPWISVLCVGYIGNLMLRSGEFPILKLATLVIYLGALAFFAAAEELTASVLLVFSDRHAAGTVLGWEVPNTALLSVNPIIIIFGGALMAKCLKNVGNSIQRTVIIGLCLTTAAFAMLAGVCYASEQTGSVHIFFVLSAVIVVSMAELCIAPSIYALCSEIAPEKWVGMTMGLIPLSYALANLIAGHFGQAMAVEDVTIDHSLRIYANGFGTFSLVLVVIMVIVVFGETMLTKVLQLKEKESLI